MNRSVNAVWAVALATLFFCQAPDVPARAEEPQALVTVFCDKILGDAAQISDFLGAGGTLYMATTPEKSAVPAAWNDLGMKHLTFETLHLEDPIYRWCVVTRDSRGEIEVDFTDYDRHMNFYLQDLKAEPLVYLGNVPRALSSCPEDEHYDTCMPKDLKEWERFVSLIVRRNVEKFGLKGILYAAPGEPDWGDNFLYVPKGGDHKEKYPNNVALFAATSRAVKAVDPTAKVGGPATMSWQLNKYTGPDLPDLRGWIAELARYNAKAALRDRVKLDFVCWQDYAWISDRISDGADAVSGFLAESGFDPDTPKVLGGSGAGSWSSNNYDAPQTPHFMASHTAYNIIREFRDPRFRKFYRAFYYFFYMDEAYCCGDPPSTEAINHNAVVKIRDGRFLRTPIYAAFQIASMMARGEIVGITTTGTLEAMAVRHNEHGSIRVAVNNHSFEETHAEIRLTDLPFESRDLSCWTWKIDETSSQDGTGLQEPRRDGFSAKGKSCVIPLTLRPYATVLLEIKET